MPFVPPDLLAAVLETTSRPNAHAPQYGCGLYGLVDHHGRLRYIGSTSSIEQELYERIHQRLRPGSEGMSDHAICLEPAQDAEFMGPPKRDVIALNPTRRRDVGIDPIDGSRSIVVGVPSGLLFSVLAVSDPGFVRSGRVLTASYATVQAFMRFQFFAGPKHADRHVFLVASLGKRPSGGCNRGCGAAISICAG